MNEETKENIESLKSIIQSCFVYGGADEDSHNFERYILPRRKYFDEKTFYKIYRKHIKHLKENFTIVENVYTDGEGVNYSSLVKNKNKTS
jgi:hypothetical protein